MKKIESIETHYLFSPHDWIFCHNKIEIYTSIDGINYNVLKTFKPKIRKPKYSKVREIISIKTQFKPQCVKYVKVVATNTSICTDWHYASGQNLGYLQMK